METKEARMGCCSPCGGSHKRKIVIIIVAVLLALAVLAIVACAKKVHNERNFAGGPCVAGQTFANGNMPGRCGSIIPVPTPSPDQFITPADAVEKGELTVIAGNADNVKQAVDAVAQKNSGSVFSTDISYAPGGAVSGSIVVQVPAGQFDAVFNELKTVGGRVVRESTEMIPQNNIVYPMSEQAQGAPTPSAAATNSPDQNATGAGSAAGAQPNIVIARPILPSAQDKGYIKVSFVENGGAFIGGRMQANGNGAMLDGNDFAQILGRNLLKGSFLILLIAIVLWFIRKVKNDAQKVQRKRTSIPAIKKATVKHAVVKRSKVVRKR